MKPSLKILRNIALLSRIIVFLLQIVFNLILPDHNADIFNPKVTESSQGPIDDFVSAVLDGFFKWDAKYFLYIAKNGYEKEQMFAFFPLFPTLLKLFSALFGYFPISVHSCLLLSGIILNTIFFIGAALAIYELTFVLYKSEKYAFLTGLLFCFNPASIFFSSNYTESLYAFCVFKGLYYLEKNKYLKATLFFIAASSTRSNGIVNAGFVMYYGVEKVIDQLLTMQAGKSNKKAKIPHLINSILIIFQTLIMCIAVFLPFIIFNAYGYYRFCSSAYETDDIIIPKWCENSIPSIYSHVQTNHWDVGFLRYFQWRKLPNFILATPCAILLLHGIYHYLKTNRDQIKTLGLCRGNKTYHNKHKERIDEKNNDLEYTKKNIFVYISHALFLTCFGIFFMHVEVITRFLMSSSPLPYWIAASYFFLDLNKFDMQVLKFASSFQNVKVSWPYLSIKTRLVILYFSTYIFIGTLLHVNNLPWT